MYAVECRIQIGALVFWFYHVYGINFINLLIDNVMWQKPINDIVGLKFSLDRMWQLLDDIKKSYPFSIIIKEE